MKVIDIYNMIANGEKVPKYKLKSTHEDNYYWVDEYGVLVYSQRGLPDTFELTNIRYDLLNNEVEIIEDKEVDLSQYYKQQEIISNVILHLMQQIDRRTYIDGSDQECVVFYVDEIKDIINELKGEDNENN